MNLNTLLTLLPLSVWIALGVSVVIPALSAAVVKEHWDSSVTGILTLALSTAAGFLTQWGAAGDGFAWKAALGTAALSWGVAVVSQSKILSGTSLEASLLALGSKASGPGSPDPTVGIDPDLPVDAPDPAPVEPDPTPVAPATPEPAPAAAPVA